MDNKMVHSLTATILTSVFAFTLMTNSSEAQSPRHGAAATDVSKLFNPDLVFGNDRVEIRHIIVKAHSKLDLRFRGGCIVVLTDFPFRVDLPLTGSTTTQFTAGDVIRLPAGEYPLENTSEKTLEFLSVEPPK